VRDKPVLRRPERCRYRGDVVAVGLIDHRSKLRPSATLPHPAAGAKAGAHEPAIRLDTSGI
jgi:hypothetical protein